MLEERPNRIPSCNGCMGWRTCKQSRLLVCRNNFTMTQLQSLETMELPITENRAALDHLSNKYRTYSRIFRTYITNFISKLPEQSHFALCILWVIFQMS